MKESDYNKKIFKKLSSEVKITEVKYREDYILFGPILNFSDILLLRNNLSKKYNISKNYDFALTSDRSRQVFAKYKISAFEELCNDDYHIEINDWFGSD